MRVNLLKTIKLAILSSFIIVFLLLLNNVKAQTIKDKVGQNKINWLLDRYKYQDIRGGTTKGLNVELDKTEQTSDWSQRKLTKQQIKYALNDVIYLSDLKKNLEAKLLEAKRLKTFKSIMNFLVTRVELDLMGWENTDIFAHK